MTISIQEYKPLHDFGSKLISKGLPIIPIKCYEKRPSISNWQNISADDGQLATWLLNGGAQDGIGLLTNRFPTIDIDIPGRHNKMRGKQVIKIFEEELGCAADYIKIGQFPKVSIICRSDTPFGPKLKSGDFRDSASTEGTKLAVEILGSGQQTVLLNRHPGSGKPYRWIRKRITDSDFNIDKLPILTREKAQRILERTEAEVFKDLEQINGRPMDSSGIVLGLSNNPFENYKPPCNFSIDQILMDLEVLDPDLPYDDWIKVGMALYHQFRGTNVGLDLFEKWSAKGTTYTPESTTNSPEAKWKTFRNDPDRNPVTFATVHMMANETRQQNIAPRQGFRFIPFNEMLKHEVNTEWLISEFLDVGSIALIFGESGTHKSFLAIDIGLCVATGKDWHGFGIKKSAPVLYIAGEGFSGISKRLKAWKKVNMTTNDSDIPFFTSSMPMEALTEKSAESVKEAISELSLEHGDPGLVVIDTLARNFGPGDENSTEDMSKFISALDRHIKAPFECCILIIHHSGLTARDRSRGSSALRAALDWEYKVEKKDSMRIFKNTKTKDHDPPPKLLFSPKIVPLINFDVNNNNDQATSCVLELIKDDTMSKIPNLKGTQEILFESLQLARLEQEILQEPNDRKRFDKLWEKYALEKGLSKGKPSSQKRAFDRGKMKLLKSGIISEKHGKYSVHIPVHELQ